MIPHFDVDGSGGVPPVHPRFSMSEFTAIIIRFPIFRTHFDFNLFYYFGTIEINVKYYSC